MALTAPIIDRNEILRNRCLRSCCHNSCSNTSSNSNIPLDFKSKESRFLLSCRHSSVASFQFLGGICPKWGHGAVSPNVLQSLTFDIQYTRILTIVVYETSLALVGQTSFLHQICPASMRCNQCSTRLHFVHRRHPRMKIKWSCCFVQSDPAQAIQAMAHYAVYRLASLHVQGVQLRLLANF
jgi:hypothetical protein